MTVSLSGKAAPSEGRLDWGYSGPGSIRGISYKKAALQQSANRDLAAFAQVNQVVLIGNCECPHQVSA